MIITNGYCSLAELKARAGITDTTDDAILKAVIESVSRRIDQHCGRHFFVWSGIRYFTANNGRRVDVDDLLSVTTFGHDSDGDRTYEENWAATDYDLLPYTALQQSPPRPYTGVEITPESDYSFNTVAKGVKITGLWGFYQNLETLDTLGAAITSTSATTFTATSGTGYSPGQTIIIDSEQMQVQGISSTTVTVKRGANGTTAATHLVAAVVSVYVYPIVQEACLLQAYRIFKRKDSPFGVLGSPDLGVVRLNRLDDDVQYMLLPLVRWR